MPNSKIIRTTPETQGEIAWAPPVGTLGKLTVEAWERSQALEAERETEGLAPDPGLARPSMAAALRKETVAVIAEIKRRSPSKGVINSTIAAADQARAYAAGGASALSVLTEPTSFGGANEDIGLAREAELPILKKDFHVSELQLVEAQALGASAALIIVRAIDPVRLADLANTAREIQLELLFEVRDEHELERALAAGAMMIGVNNRNLETLVINPETVPRILPLIPSSCIAIAESGYSSAADVERAAAAGADAVLVGSALSASPDPSAAVALISAIPRKSRRN